MRGVPNNLATGSSDRRSDSTSDDRSTATIERQKRLEDITMQLSVLEARRIEDAPNRSSEANCGTNLRLEAGNGYG
jgi:hypothetical protein